MKVFKLILVLVMLISMSVFATYNQPLTQGEISDWQESLWNTKTEWRDTPADNDILVWDDDKSCWEWKLIDPKDPTSTLIQCKKPYTLLEWFKSLTLDEKVEIYNLWKDKGNTKDTFYNEIYMPQIIDDRGDLGNHTEGGEK